ncbi:hypothetical protein [uncultured Nostoc sp.]|uniref:hypothetical protein n=1 Tax=uncultured Nostoc sp. TaxID=340711 RepID=UPI0035CC2AA6
MKYTEEEVELCPTCGWDLTPYPITFQLPDEFLRREQVKLAWAKQIWTRNIQEVALTRSQLEEFQQERSHLKSQLSEIHAQLQKIQQERSENQSKLKFLEEKVLTLKSQLEQVKSEKEEFQTQLFQAQAQLQESNKERLHIESELRHVKTEQTQLQEQRNLVLSKLKQLVKESSASDVNTLFSSLEEGLDCIETRWEQMSRKVLTGWIPSLILELAQGLAYTPDKSTAKADINDVLQYKELSAHTSSFLKSIQSALNNQNLDIENLKDYLAECVAEIGKENLITQVDVLLEARRELKFKGIITDGGPSLYDA